METDVLNLIELLMNQLLKLDGIMADGDVKLQRKMQVNDRDLDAFCSFFVLSLHLKLHFVMHSWF